MKSRAVGLVGLLVVSVAGVAEGKPKHQGFTGDLSIGPSMVLVRSRDPEFGLAGLSVSLGGYVTPEVALLARLAGTSFFDDGNQWGNNFYGAAVEVWPHPYLFLGGGVGFALFGQNPLYSSGDVEQKGGWALDFRIGTALAQGTNHDFILGLEVLPGFYDAGTVIGFGLTGGWKWY